MGAAFLPLKILLIAIDFMITLVTFGWLGILKKKSNEGKLRSVPVGDDESHRVKTGYRGNLAKCPQGGEKTLYEGAQSSFKNFADVNFLGSRKFLGWKTPKVKEFGETSWRTYGQVKKLSDNFGAALAAAGVKPAPTTTNLDKVTTNCRMAIFENTCAEWMIGALGAFSQSVTVVTVYATLGIEAVAEAVDENLISVILCNKCNVAKLVEMKGKMPTLTHIVYTNDLIAPDDTTEIPNAPDGMTIMSFDDFCASGDTSAYPSIPPAPETTSVIMYTSGSTGKPKGVVLTHAQCMACVACLELEFGLRKGMEQHIGYLPLAHIMEMMAEFGMCMLGCSIGYADPKSLTATGASPIGALECFKPTILIAVPKIWDTIKKGTLAKVALSSPVAQFLVHTAIEWRTFALNNGFDTPLFNKLVFKKLKAAVGGNLLRAVSGGGPLNGEVQAFCRACFSPIMIQGYGLTETAAGLTIQAADDMRPLVAGSPIPSVEVKVESTPEIGDKAGQPYLSTDRRDVEGNPVFGRGEICVKGHSVSSGYYMKEEATKESYGEDGWFHTGDIGQFLSDGSIRIVDRKKNLVKLKGGEYIALEKMEMTYGNSSYVDAIQGGICCYGDGDLDRPVALMQLNEPVAMAWAKQNGVDGDFESIKNSKALYDAVMKDLKTEHSKSDLSHLEKLAGVVFVESPWTPENGCLTAANKLQRRMVVNHCEAEFEDAKKKGIF